MGSGRPLGALKPSKNVGGLVWSGLQTHFVRNSAIPGRFLTSLPDPLSSAPCWFGPWSTSLQRRRPSQHPEQRHAGQPRQRRHEELTGVRSSGSLMADGHACASSHGGHQTLYIYWVWGHGHLSIYLYVCLSTLCCAIVLPGRKSVFRAPGPGGAPGGAPEGPPVFSHVEVGFCRF